MIVRQSAADGITTVPWNLPEAGFVPLLRARSLTRTSVFDYAERPIDSAQSIPRDVISSACLHGCKMWAVEGRGGAKERASQAFERFMAEVTVSGYELP